MKKTFFVEDLDCAHCAAKIEEGIKKIDGVEFCSLSFIAQRLVLEAEESRFPEIIKEVKKVIKKIEPDCKISEE